MPANDPAAVVCTRTGSAVAVGVIGWLHELRSGPTWPKWRLSLPKLAKGTHADA